MAVQRKPKKALIQFAIAAVVAVVIGIGAVALTLMVVSNANGEAQRVAQEAEEEKKRLAEALEAARQTNKQHEKINFKEVQAVVDISPGQPITKDMITLAETQTRPDSLVANRLGDVVGKIAKAGILAGESVSRGNLIDSSGWVSVPEGMRAITIQVDNIGGLNGALNAGAYVDILSSITNGEQTISRTLLQNVQVVSVGGGSAAAGGTPTGSSGAVTLVVTPRQAELLTLANQLGKFHLTLRNFKDKSKSRIPGSDLHELLTGKPGGTASVLPPPPSLPAGLNPGSGHIPVSFTPGSALPTPEAPSPKPGFSMQIYKGTGTETVTFDQ